MRNINRRVLYFSLIIQLFLITSIQSVLATIPRPDHVVICILENHSYSQVIGSPNAPYINYLTSVSANMMEYYALTHPSQPNYLMLFSGSNQGETTDNLPAGTPWSTPNLGSALLDAGLTFAGYSEGLPSPGSTVGTSGAYARKHCPWVNWQGNGPNQIPASCNLSMTDFPTNYSHLPDVSFVIPDQNNDMHNGTDPSRILAADVWLDQNLSAYVDWAPYHNSLFILLFDEDDFSPVNHIPCLIFGPMVVPGEYYLNGYHHYDMLRTLEDMFNLPYTGEAANSIPIEEIWSTGSTDVNYLSDASITSSVFPNPLTYNSKVLISNNDIKNNGEAHLIVYDIAGRVINDESINLLPGKNGYPFPNKGLAKGIYTYMIRNERSVISSGKAIMN